MGRETANELFKPTDVAVDVVVDVAEGVIASCAGKVMVRKAVGSGMYWSIPPLRPGSQVIKAWSTSRKTCFDDVALGRERATASPPVEATSADEMGDDDEDDEKEEDVDGVMSSGVA